MENHDRPHARALSAMLWAQVLRDIYLDQQRQERAREVASDEPGSIRQLEDYQRAA
jgi:hypothetical protein